MHYGFGALIKRALYGVAAEHLSVTRVAAGSAFGLAVWVGSELLALPALRLSRKEYEYPAWVALYGTASHVVYGLATELARRRLANR